MTPSDQRPEEPIQYVQTTLFGDHEVVPIKPKRRKRQAAESAVAPPPRPSTVPPGRWEVRLRLWAKSAAAVLRWLGAKARDKAVELVVSALIASGAGYLGLDAWFAKARAPGKTPAAVEKGWEAKVHKAR